jgi:hypothetical protein
MFIGRTEILKHIKQEKLEQSTVNGICGDLGSGRTSLLNTLQSGIPNVRSVPVPLENFDPGHPGQVGDTASVGAVQANFVKFTELLEFLVQEVCPSEKAAMKEAIQKARNDKVRLGRLISIDASVAEIDQPLTPQDVSRAWREAAEAVSQDFQKLWQACNPGCLLLLDDFDSLAKQEIGGWLQQLLLPVSKTEADEERLPRTIVVLTRSPGTPKATLTGIDAEWSIGNFTKAEVAEYLREVRNGEYPEDATLNMVYEITGGHPATLRLVHELVWGGMLAHDQPELLLRDLTREPREERAAVLVERMVERLEAPDLMAAIQAGAVPRRFDSRLLAALLDGDGAKVRAMPDSSTLFETIRKLPFTELVPALENRVVLRLHPYVRKSLIARMQVAQAELLQRLHERAARYYQDLLSDDFKDSRGRTYQYGDWYYLEQPKWQERKREWLFHAAQIYGREPRQSAVLEFTRLFLDAFWWWGNYVHFDFCDQLLADVASLMENREDAQDETSTAVPALAERSWPRLRSLHGAFSRILADYPLRSVKSAHANWGEVRNALLQVQSLCMLSPLPKRPSVPEKHIAALLHVFLAHSWRYEAPSSLDKNEWLRIADLMYGKAYDLCSDGDPEKDDPWNRAWINFERSEMGFSRAKTLDMSAAKRELDTIIMPLWRAAAAIVQPHDQDISDGIDNDGDHDVAQEEESSEQSDDELISNLHRLRAEMKAFENEPIAAARSYGRAVMHAYLFNGAAGSNELGEPPDDYTLQFYTDVRARAISYLKHLYKDNNAELAVDCATEMWKVAWQGSPGVSAPNPDELRELLGDVINGTAAPLARKLFPRGPWVEELGFGDSKFLNELRLTRGILQLDDYFLRDLYLPA